MSFGYERGKCYTAGKRRCAVTERSVLRATAQMLVRRIKFRRLAEDINCGCAAVKDTIVPLGIPTVRTREMGYDIYKCFQHIQVFIRLDRTLQPGERPMLVG